MYITKLNASVTDINDANITAGGAQKATSTDHRGVEDQGHLDATIGIRNPQPVELKLVASIHGAAASGAQPTQFVSQSDDQGTGRLESLCAAMEASELMQRRALLAALNERDLVDTGTTRAVFEMPVTHLDGFLEFAFEGGGHAPLTISQCSRIQPAHRSIFFAIEERARRTLTDIASVAEIGEAIVDASQKNCIEAFARNLDNPEFKGCLERLKIKIQYAAHEDDDAFQPAPLMLLTCLTLQELQNVSKLAEGLLASTGATYISILGDVSFCSLTVLKAAQMLGFCHPLSIKLGETFKNSWLTAEGSAGLAFEEREESLSCLDGMLLGVEMQIPSIRSWSSKARIQVARETLKVKFTERSRFFFVLQNAAVQSLEDFEKFVNSNRKMFQSH